MTGIFLSGSKMLGNEGDQQEEDCYNGDEDASRDPRSVETRPHAKRGNPTHRPLSRRLDRCDRMIQNESRYPNGGNVYYVRIQISFVTRKFRNVERNLHCDVVHITTVSSLTLDCNGVFAIKAYRPLSRNRHCNPERVWRL